MLLESFSILAKTNGCIWNDTANSFFGVVILNATVVGAV